MASKLKGEPIEILNVVLLGLIALGSVYPIYFVIIASVSDPSEVILGNVRLIPKGLTPAGYEKIFANGDIGRSYLNTVFYTVFGTAINIVMTISTAYVLSRKKFSGKKIIMRMMVFTMYFGGGLIPSYFLYRAMGIIDTFWVMILPGAVSVYNMILARTFIASNLPEEMYEAAAMDGCSHFRYLARIVLPLSGPIIAVLTLYYAVGHWNSYFNAMVFLSKRSMFPLQIILREILIQNKFSAEDLFLDPDIQANTQALAEQIKFGLVVVASIPVLLIYPFIQKYFTKGVMIGSIKG
jgi:putative aldouronate transport system permease protein